MFCKIKDIMKGLFFSLANIQKTYSLKPDENLNEKI